MMEETNEEIREKHVEKVWCENLRCGQCYDADRWVNTLIQEREDLLKMKVYAWLGQWRDEMLPEAVSHLQNLLGPPDKS